MTFKDKLKNLTLKNNSLLCIGLDTDLDKLPVHLKKQKHPQFEFNKAVIDATFDLVCSFKPNIAFYEAQNMSGLLQLKFTLDHIKKNYPEIPVILDAKRGDIGNSNTGYAKLVFDYLNADAVTVHPFLGKQSLAPFLDRKDKGIFILCRTSNEGGGEFQDLKVNSRPLYQIIAQHVIDDWNKNDNCALVVGATYPAELEIVRRLANDMPLLIPGVGVQGGDLEKTVKAGVDKDGRNAVINSSRGIIFASQGEDFADAARQQALNLKNQINNCR